ncbi:hypothetical protein TNCV_145751 [Trichonephila clavipes]|nr:hypothetical protein TNCV_145751 [Trichonephila clavipes]
MLRPLPKPIRYSKHRLMSSKMHYLRFVDVITSVGVTPVHMEATRRRHLPVLIQDCNTAICVGLSVQSKLGSFA